MGGLKMNKINVAIADDNQRTVEMMTELLEQESDIEVKMCIRDSLRTVQKSCRRISRDFNKAKRNINR